MPLSITGSWNVVGAVSLDTVALMSAVAGTTTAVAALQNQPLTSFSPFSSVTGGYLPYTYFVSSGILPPGLTFDPTTGLVSGTPTTVQNLAPVVFAVRDLYGNQASTTVTVNFAVQLQYSTLTAIAGTTTALPGAQNVAITSFNPFSSVSGGLAPYTYSISSGTLPTGITLNASTGQVSGTPTILQLASNVIFVVKDLVNNQAATTVTVSFSVSNLYDINYLVVGAGGGGGGTGGGGGGGVAVGAVTLTASPNYYTITLGAGGAGGIFPGNGSPGGNTTFSGSGITTVTAGGGGGGFGSLGNNAGGRSPVYPVPGAPGYQAGGLGGSNNPSQTGPGGGGGGAGGAGGNSGVSTVPPTGAGFGAPGYFWPFTNQAYGGGGGGGGGTSAGPGAPGGGPVAASPVPPGGGGYGGGSINVVGPTFNYGWGSGTATSGYNGGGGGGGGWPHPAGPVSCLMPSPGVSGCGSGGVVSLAINNAAYPTISAPGATVSTPPAAQGYTILTYNTAIANVAATYNILVGTGYTVQYLVVGGGGGTAYSYYPYTPNSASGGGGGGGYLSGSATLSPGATYTIQVGGGGAGVSPISPNRIGVAGNPGKNSNISGLSQPGFATIDAIGGGAGGGWTCAPQPPSAAQPGGSGGGASFCQNGTSPSGTLARGVGYLYPSPIQQGYPGGGLSASCSAGGGGGAGGPGGTRTPVCGSTSGGIGRIWPYTGLYYAGGGGGFSVYGGGCGGQGGGGCSGNPGTPGLGGGAGGSRGQTLTSSGGSGTVILAVPNARYPSVIAPGAAVSNPPAAPGYTVLTYTTPTPTTPATYIFTA